MSRNGSTDWYRSAFGELYPLLYPHRDDASAAREMRSLVDLLGLVGSRAPTLDLCCGTGRHMVALRRLGLDVVGLDLSPELLARARRRPPLAGRLTRGDMRRLPLGTRFDLVVNLFTSFGYFPDEPDNARAMREMARVLRPGGRLVIDHINQGALMRDLVPADSRRGSGFTVHQRRRIDGVRVRKEITVVWDEGRTLELTENVRFYAPEEMQDLLVACGLRAVAWYGSFGGDGFSAQAPRMIVVATRSS